MAVIKLTTVENFTGLSTDIKPTDIKTILLETGDDILLETGDYLLNEIYWGSDILVKVGSTFFEYDTKDFFFTYDGTNWTKKKRNSDLDTNSDWKKEN